MKHVPVLIHIVIDELIFSDLERVHYEYGLPALQIFLYVLSVHDLELFPYMRSDLEQSEIAFVRRGDPLSRESSRRPVRPVVYPVEIRAVLLHYEARIVSKEGELVCSLIETFECPCIREKCASLFIRIDVSVDILLFDLIIEIEAHLVIIAHPVHEDPVVDVFRHDEEH